MRFYGSSKIQCPRCIIMRHESIGNISPCIWVDTGLTEPAITREHSTIRLADTPPESLVSASAAELTYTKKELFDSLRRISARRQHSAESSGLLGNNIKQATKLLQHVRSLLKINGRAAIVVPDNVLFEGGAGETVRRKLLHECDVHTLLRLPTGVFYAQGVKANVLFFDRKSASQNPWTEKLWIYDLRTNQHFTLKTNPLKYEDLQDFIKCYNPDNRHQRQETERFHAFTNEELVKRDKCSLDVFWLKDESLVPPSAQTGKSRVSKLQRKLSPTIFWFRRVF